MQSAVALRTTLICASSPRPASLPLTVSALSSRVIVNALLMKCGLPAQAAGTARAAVASANTVTSKNRRIAHLAWFDASKTSAVPSRPLLGSTPSLPKMPQRSWMSPGSLRIKKGMRLASWPLRGASYGALNLLHRLVRPGSRREPVHHCLDGRPAGEVPLRPLRVGQLVARIVRPGVQHRLAPERVLRVELLRERAGRVEVIRRGEVNPTRSGYLSAPGDSAARPWPGRRS